MIYIILLFAAVWAVRKLRENRKNKRAESYQYERGVSVPVFWQGKYDEVALISDDIHFDLDMVKTSTSATAFVFCWDEMIKKAESLTAYYNKYGTAVNELIDEVEGDVSEISSDFQWKLRDAIERQENETLSLIKKLYRNSREHKKELYDSFYYDLSSISERFSEETLDFANEALNKVYKTSKLSSEQYYIRPSSISFAAPQSRLQGSEDEYVAEDELKDVDYMEGHAFEYWCADLLKRNGFTDVTVTKGSGDQGVDVLAKKDGIKFAIQCKCYTSDLGNAPVQQVHTGKTYYGCQIGVVMTNRYFTAGAKDAAERTGVLLWDRDTLRKMLEQGK